MILCPHDKMRKTVKKFNKTCLRSHSFAFLLLFCVKHYLKIYVFGSCINKLQSTKDPSLYSSQYV